MEDRKKALIKIIAAFMSFIETALSTTMPGYFILKNLIIILIFERVVKNLALGKILGLRCMICKSGPKEKDTNDFDSFRVHYHLKEPICELEPVECRDEQDACVMITMEINPKKFWVGSGCDQRINYPISFEEPGCVEIPSYTRKRTTGYIEIIQNTQKICICTENYCNDAFNQTSNSITTTNTKLMLLLIFIVAILR